MVMGGGEDDVASGHGIERAMRLDRQWVVADEVVGRRGDKGVAFGTSNWWTV